jgi:hypothetical protein
MKNATRCLVMVALAATLLSVRVGPAAAWQGKQNSATITVRNTRKEPVVVYLDDGAFDIRLGTVEPQGTRTMELPSFLTEGEKVMIFVHPEGGADLATPGFTVKKGKNLDILVPTNDVGYLPPQPPELTPNPGEGTTTLTVENNRPVELTVLMEGSRFDTRLGTVPPTQERTIDIPDWLAGQRRTAEIIIHPEGGLDLSSQSFTLTPGSHLLLKVPLRGE